MSFLYFFNQFNLLHVCSVDIIGTPLFAKSQNLQTTKSILARDEYDTDEDHSFPSINIACSFLLLS